MAHATNTVGQAHTFGDQQPVQQRSPAELRQTIPGWGSDLPRSRRPGVPKEAAPPLPTGAHWNQPEQQRTDVKIYHSIERPGITQVFGTTLPPKGLSGKIRDVAYQLGENLASRWMLLLLADRVDVIESAVGEMLHGRVLMHPIRDRGWKSEFQRPGEAVGYAQEHQATLPGGKRLAIGAAVALGLGVLAYSQRRNLAKVL